MATCFVSLPSSAPFDSYYKQILAGAIMRVGLEPVRAEDIGRPRAFDQIREGVRNAAACVADLTGLSAGVLYALGLAHGLGTPVVLLAQSSDELPFDLRFVRYVVYHPGAARWQDMFSMQLQAALRALAPLSA